MVIRVEVNSGGLPFIADFVEPGGDQAQERGLVGEEAGDASAAFKFLVDPFQGVAGAQSELRLNQKDCLLPHIPHIPRLIPPLPRQSQATAGLAD